MKKVVMKKITTILSISACLLAFTSCEDWLDMPSESKADSTTIFESLDRAEMAVVGAYNSLNNKNWATSSWRERMRVLPPKTTLNIM